MLPITSNKIELVIKKLQTNKSPGEDGLIFELYQIFKEELWGARLAHSVESVTLDLRIVGLSPTLGVEIA